MTIDRNGSTVTFGVPDARVEMKPMAGRDGKVVEIHNLPADFLDGYTQFVSVRNSFEAGGEGFEHSGTNGFTSRLVAGN